jgi:hypothetical protein
MKNSIIPFILVLSLSLVSASLDVINIKSPPSTIILNTNITNFTQLLDTPNSYSGQSGKCVAVKSGEDGIEFITCATGSGDITAVYITAPYLTGGGTSGEVTIGFNETFLNQTILNIASIFNETDLILSINKTSNIMALGFYNKTEVDNLIAGVSAGNSSFNQSLTDSLYYKISNPLNFINHTEASIYNDTLLILSVNSSLWSYINNNEAAWLSTYNSTYNTLLNQECPTNQYAYFIQINGTILCREDQVGGSGNPFDQILNTTSSVTFFNITLIGYLNLNDTVEIDGIAGMTRIYSMEFHGVSVLKAITGLNEGYQLGRDSLMVVRNMEGNSISRGQVVYIKGATGNVPNVGLARADSELTLPSIGLVYDNMNNGSYGRIIVNGKLENFDTDIFSPGDVVYVNITNAGSIQNIKPTTGFIQRIGNILVSGVGNGAIEIDRGAVFSTTTVTDTQKTTDGLYLYNDTTTIYFNETLLNNTIDARSINTETDPIFIAENSSLWTEAKNKYNVTYNNILNQLCPAGKVVNGTLANGTFICTTPTAVETDPIFIAENSSLWTEAKNKYNVTYATFSYNQTTPANSYTDTVISNNNASWITTYNTTYNNILNQQCPSGMVVNGTLSNGTFTCTTDQTGGSGNPFDQTLNTTSNVTFGGIVLPSGSNFNMSFSSYEQFGNNGGLSLRGLTPTAKPSIEFYSWDDGTKSYRGVGWLVCHYNLSNGNTHSHCSWETLDNSTGTPTINSHFEISYNGSQPRARVKFPTSDVQFISDQKLYFGDNFNAWIQHNSGVGGLQLNGTTVRISSPLIMGSSDDIRGVNNIQSNAGSNIDLEAGAGSSIRAFPSGQTTIGLSITNTTNDLSFIGLGTSYFIFQDNINVTEGLDVCITGGNCLSKLTSGSDGTGGWTNDSINTNTSLNVNLLNGANITANWLNGKFNWTTDVFMIFNGIELLMNTTQLNKTISDLGVLVGFNSTYNITYNNILNQQCPAGKVVNGTLANGTFTCTTDQTGGSGNPFDQTLNTTSNVTFDVVNLKTVRISGANISMINGDMVFVI